MEDIQYLNSRGAEIRLVNFSGIMHHKFCVIDKKLCMFGSFNWTESANVRNVEDLNLCDDIMWLLNIYWNLKHCGIWERTI